MKLLVGFFLLFYSTIFSFAAEKSANTLSELNSQIRACLIIPPAPEGGDMTLLFSIKRDGQVLGKPRIVFAKQLVAPKNQAQFIGSVLAALEACFPLKITESLGAAIAGRPFRYRITQPAHETGV